MSKFIRIVDNNNLSLVINTDFILYVRRRSPDGMAVINLANDKSIYTAVPYETLRDELVELEPWMKGDDE